jgi:hypothetical protein
MAEKIEGPTLASRDSGSSKFTGQNSLNTKDEAVVAIQNFDGNEEASITDDELNRNPFADPKVAAYYTTVYEKSKYECRHVFDPTLEWTAAEERKIVRKLDWHVCLWAVSVSRLYRNVPLTGCSAPCSLLCRSIEEISVKQCLITCWISFT